MQNSIKTINPYDFSEIQEYHFFDDSKISSIIDKADECFEEWKKTSFGERNNLILNIAENLSKNKNPLAELITKEMGKPISEAVSEIEKCVFLCEYYAENGESQLKDIEVKTEATKSYITSNPLGVIFGVMPWNFPFWQVFRFAIPTILAGNSVILKHAENVTGCALKIEKIFRDSGAKNGLFSNIIARVEQVENIISNPKVKAVTLTGSTRAGKSVASLAGKYLKKSVLELGGSDPYIILKDADLEEAIDICVKSKMLNGGQTCIAAKRFIIEEEIYDKFLQKFTEKMRAIKFDDPRKPETRLGTMASKEHRDNLHKLVEQSISDGAKCILGGELPDKKGAFYPTTILTDIDKNNIANREEFFGPVALMFKVKNEDRAVKLANRTSFGLGAGIFTRDTEKANKIAKEKLDCGVVYINDFVKSDPRLPFGGVKESGYGRELSEFGIREFTNIKTVYIK